MNIKHLITIILLTISLTITSAATAQVTVKPLFIGESIELASKTMQEIRRINVYLPDGYQQDQSKTYPVIYMPDGGIAEDFLHIAGLMQVSIANGTMRPFILVGIENTVRRRDLTGPSDSELDKKAIPNLGGADLYRHFLTKELIPEIEQRYRTTNERALVGESLAGLFTIETLFHMPEMFQTYIAIDPSLWWNDQALTARFAEKLKTNPQLPKNLYFASSGQRGMEQVIKSFAEMLKLQQPKGLNWNYEHFAKETHATIYHPAALIAFRKLFAPVAPQQ
ncbi:alpha/beta hydrolase [Undibacterium sp. Ji22W]|uniref:alpha/beta hydrolase n=1 Tax=Undibacterium sp. Ji22W TaxID=3413038 RepID=UPI003BF04737